MIHSISINNFYSFAEDTELSLVVDGRASINGSSFTSDATQKQISKATAVIGPNGAGKTNLIKAISFLSWFISDSFNNDKSRSQSIKPSFSSQSDVTSFSLEFEIEAKLYRYALKLRDNDVIHESLLVKTSRLFSRVFIRDLNEDDTYTIVQTNFGLDKKQASLVKKHSSLISTAAQYNIELANKIVNEFKKVTTNVSIRGRDSIYQIDIFESAKKIYGDTEAIREIADMLTRWDLGLHDIQLEKIDRNDGNPPFYTPFGFHKIGEEIKALPFFEESSGTQAAFVLLSKLLPALKAGGVVVLDEIESDLHPLMLHPIIDLFLDEETNPHNAQLIFTCHSIEIISMLQKHQIVLVEKDENCISHAWKLSDMKDVRSDENFYMRYMSGSYGAVPNIY